MNRSRKFTREIISTLLLAGPVVVTQLGQISMGFVDTMMVGRISPDALAAVALGNNIFFFVILFGMGVLQAVSPMVSQAFGARIADPIGRAVRQGMWLAVVIGAPSFLIIWFVPPMLVHLGQPPDTVVAARTYMQAMAWGVLPFLWFVCLRGFIEGVGRPRPATIITLAGVLLNVAANYILMFGKLGFPELGIVGTGYASSIVYWFMFLGLAASCAFTEPFKSYEIFARLGKPDLHYFRELVRIGWPIGTSFIIEAGLFMVTALMMGTLGNEKLAAHQIALQCAAFTFMVPLGIGMASSVRVGQSVGRNDPDGVMMAGFTGISLAATFMFVAAIVFWVFPRTLVGLYVDLDLPANQDVIALAVSLIGIAAVFQIFDGIQVSAAGALRGLKDTRVPMLLALVAYWGIGLVTGYALGFVAGFGATGLWWGLVVGLAGASIMLTLRFRIKGLQGLRLPNSASSGISATRSVGHD